MKHFKKLLGVAVSIVMIFSSSLAVYAADPYIDCGSETGNINVQPYSNIHNDVWMSIINK